MLKKFLWEIFKARFIITLKRCKEQHLTRRITNSSRFFFPILILWQVRLNKANLIFLKLMLTQDSFLPLLTVFGTKRMVTI